MQLSADKLIPYEALILATGARARRDVVPDSNVSGVYLLRTMADATRLQDALRASRNTVVVGGGFIGLELAGAAAARGLQVTVFELADKIMARAVTSECADWFSEFHRRNGVDVRTGTGIVSIDAMDGRVRAVDTTDGVQVAADTVVVGGGAVPDVHLAEAAGLTVDDGVLVDATLRTSDPHIWAVGDCARFVDTRTGRSTRLESVQNATDQGRCAGANAVATLSGEATVPYSALPLFWSRQGAARLQIAGTAGTGEQTVAIRRYGDAKLSVLGFDDGRLAFVESINAPADHMAARALLTRCVSVDPARVADPNV